MWCEFRALTAWGKKLLSSLAERALILRYRLPEGRSWKRLWEGWVGSSTILFALLEHRVRKMSRMEGRGAPMIFAAVFTVRWRVLHKKKAHQRLFFLRRLRKFGTSPRILRSFYTCTVESILTGCITAWFGNSTAGNRRALQRVVRTARHIVGGELPSLQDIYTRRCTRKARRIIKDSSHPSHSLLSLLPSGRRFRSIRSRTSRLRDSFFPQAIRLMNSQK